MVVATANIRKKSVFRAGYPRERVCQFFGGPPAASTQHRSAIRQQIRGQQAPQQAPRAAHSKLSPRSEIEAVAIKPSSCQQAPSRPKPAAASASRGAVLVERGWRAAGQLDGQILSAALLHATRSYQPYVNALALALASPAAWQGGLRDWLPQCHGHRQRSSRAPAAAAAHAPAPKAAAAAAHCDRMPQSSATHAEGACIPCRGAHGLTTALAGAASMWRE